MLSGTTVLAVGTQATLAKSLADGLGADLIIGEVRTFPDGESKITLSGTPSGRCVVVQSTHPPVDENLVRSLVLVSEAANYAKEVVAVVPYMGYARQDRQFLSGEIITVRRITGLFAGAGASRLVTVDMHSRRGLGYFGDVIQNVSAMQDLAAHCIGMDLADPLVVSPDRGGQERADMFARIMKTDWLALDKERNRHTGEISVRNGDTGVAGRDIVLADDMISTGGSMTKATRLLKSQGCGRVVAACTHALMVNDAAIRMLDAGVDCIVAANTIPGQFGVVDVSGAILNAL